MNTATKVTGVSDNTKEEVLPKQSPYKEKKHSSLGRSLRSLSVIILIILICSVCCITTLAAGYYTGHLQKLVCDNTVPNAPIYQQLKCADLSVQTVNTNSQYPVKEDQGTTPATGTIGVTGIDAAAIYAQASKSVVGVGIQDTNNTSNPTQIIGSGFVVSANGLIATNQHVVSDQQASYFVKFIGNDEDVPVTKIYRDQVNDIAILVVAKTNLPSLVLGNSDNLQPGQSVLAIGNPLGQFSGSVTAGIISGLHREVSVGQTFLRSNVTTFEDTIQTDAAINPGNSGGPMLDAKGNVIGINFASVQGYENISFAQPVSYLKSRLDELAQFGKFKIPYLGVQSRLRLVNYNGQLTIGAEVMAVDSKGKATGKLAVGDVILSFAGKSLVDNNLTDLVQRSKIGSTVDIEVINQKGEKRTVSVEIVENPN